MCVIGDHWAGSEIPRMMIRGGGGSGVQVLGGGMVLEAVVVAGADSVPPPLLGTASVPADYIILGN